MSCVKTYYGNVYTCCAISLREVEFAGRARSEVVRYNSVDFGAKGLDSDWASISITTPDGSPHRLHDCHFSPD